MKEEKHYRHELKYEVSYTDYLAVANRIRKVMRPDPHAGEDMAASTGMMKNLAIYGICFLAMIMSLFIIKRVRRRI